MTNHKQDAIAKFPTARAVREPRASGGGFTVVENGKRIAWAPSATEAWRIASCQPAWKVGA